MAPRIRLCLVIHLDIGRERATIRPKSLTRGRLVFYRSAVGLVAFELLMMEPPLCFIVILRYSSGCCARRLARDF